MSEPEQRLQRRYEREKRARLQAEEILENKSRELFELNTRLRLLSDELEEQVEQRTRELQDARDQALKSDRAKSDFLANISHEIKTPLNGLLGMVQALKFCDEPEKKSHFFSTAEESGELLLTKINDILEFVELDSQTITLNKTEFKLEQILADLTQNFAKKAHNKNLDFINFISPTLPATVTGDAIRLISVLEHLLNNAIKFTEHGYISFSAKKLDEKNIHFSIQDTGIGIKNGEEEILFDAFNQADSANTRKFGGTGLGLSIASAILKVYNSSIHVNSEYGKGSNFSFTLELPASTSETLYDDTFTQERKICFIVNSECRVFKQSLEDFHQESKGTQYIACERLDKNLSTKLNEGFEYFLFIDKREIPPDELRECLSLYTSIDNLTIIHTTSQEESSYDHVVDRVIKKPLQHSDLKNLFSNNSKSPATSSGKEPNSANFANKKLLVVDDNEVNIEVAVEVFEYGGFDVSTASSGQEAIEQIKAHQFDLVLLDIQMPGMDGLTTARKIREIIDDSTQMKIIAMTAHASTEDREKSLAAGMDDHIVKPIEASVIFPKLVEHLGINQNLHTKEIDSEEKETNTTDIQEIEIPKLPGFNLEAALARIHGRWHRLKPLIINFCENNCEADKRIKEMLAENRFEEAASLAHQLKGSGASIGAENLSSTAAEIEEQLKANNSNIPDSILSKMTQEIKQLSEAAVILSQDEASEPEQGTTVERQDVVGILHKIKTNINIDLSETYDDIETLSSLTKNTDYEDIARQISNAYNQFKLKEIESVIEQFENT